MEPSKDMALDIVDIGFSPGVRRMMGQAGGKEAFEEGQRDLEALANRILLVRPNRFKSLCLNVKIE
jgi:hypothetical protein